MTFIYTFDVVLNEKLKKYVAREVKKVAYPWCRP